MCSCIRKRQLLVAALDTGVANGVCNVSTPRRSELQGHTCIHNGVILLVTVSGALENTVRLRRSRTDLGSRLRCIGRRNRHRVDDEQREE